MRSLNDKINSLVKTGRLKKGLLGISAVLSLVVVLVVAGMLTRPAISMTQEEVMGDFVVGNAINLTGKVSIPQNEITGSYNDGADTVTASVKFEYTLKADETVSKLPGASDNRYVYLEIDKDVTNIANRLGEVKDPEYTAYLATLGESAPSGNYYIETIDEGKSRVVIKFTEEYLDFLANVKKSGVTKGDFTLKADFARDENKGTTQNDYTLGGDTFTIKGFKVLEPGIEKNANKNDDGTITWTVTVNNPNNNNPMSTNKISTNKCWVEDTMFKNAVDGIHITGTGAAGQTDKTINIGLDKVHTGDHEGSSGENDILYISEAFATYGAGTYYPKYVITYKTKIPTDISDGQFVNWGTNDDPNTAYDFSQTNIAKLYINGNKLPDVSKKVEQFSRISLGKGEPTPNYENNTLEWTLTITNSDGLDINGMTITDDAFSNLAAGTSIEVSSGEFTVDDNVLTFTGANTAKQITIKYSVPALEDENVENVAYLKDGDNSISKASKNATYNKLWADKSGKVNKTNSNITWTVSISTQGNSLDGYVFDDEMLQNIQGEVSIVGNGSYWDKTVSIAKDADTGKYVIHTEDCKEAKITYTTPLNTDSKNYGGVVSDDGTTVVYNNKGTISEGPFVQHFEGKATDKSINEVSKGASNPSISADGTAMSATWTISLTQNPGSYAGKTVEDSFSLPEGFTVSNLDSIEFNISGKNESDGNITLTKDENYEITVTAAGFNLKFADNIDSALYKVTISYTLNYAVDLDKTAAGTIIEVGNTVSYNEKSDGDTVKYYRRDYSTPPYKKTVNDKEKTTIQKSDLVKDGDYYYIEYVIEVIDGNNTIVLNDENYNVIVDTLDPIFEFYSDSSRPVMLFDKNNPNANYTIGTINKDQIGHVVNWQYVSGYYYDTENGKNDIYFSLKDEKMASCNCLKYSARISCEDLDTALESGNLTANNTVKHDQYPEKTHELIITPSKPTPGQEEPLVYKGSGFGKDESGNDMPQIDAGYYKYTVELNKEAKKLLADGETLTVIDTMDCTSYKTGSYNEFTGDLQNVSTHPGNNQELSPEIRRIVIYSVDAVGNKKEIEGWKYTMKANPGIDHDYGSNSIPYGALDVRKDEWTVEHTNGYEVPVEASKTYTIKYFYKDKPDNVWNAPGWYYVGNESGNQWVEAANKSYADGVYTMTITAPDNAAAGDTLKLCMNSNNEFEHIEVTDGTTTWGSNYFEPTSLSKMTITGLPDETHLLIEYTVFVQDKENEYAVASITNNAQLYGTSQTGSYSADIVVSEQSSASSQGEQYLSLQKVDVGDYHVTLSAGFKLFRWDSTNNGWKPAISVAPPAENPNANFMVAKWGDVGDVDSAAEIVKNENTTLNLQLDPNVLYKISETKEPDSFSFDGLDQFFGSEDGYVTDFYFSFKQGPETLPDLPNGEVIRNYKVIDSSSQYYISNVRKINLSFKKNWVGLPEGSGDNVAAEFELYRTTDLDIVNAEAGTIERINMNVLKDKGCIDQANIMSEYTFKLSGSGDSSIVNIKNIPNGEDNNGSEYYYYVKEVAYTLDGNTWTTIDDESDYIPFYTGNFINIDSEIDITNANGLIIKKIWKNSKGETLDPVESTPAISFNLYRVEDDGSYLSDDDIYSEDNLVGSYDLNYANAFMTSIKCNTLPGYVDGVSYLYYVKETSNIADNEVTYYNNGTTGDLAMEIINTSTVEEETGITLPNTGGSGFKVLMIFGLALAAVAGVLLTIKRRQDI